VFYHIRLEIAGNKYDEVALNLSRESVLQDIAIPFISGQVTEVKFLGYSEAKLVNMRAVTSLGIYESRNEQTTPSFIELNETANIKECTRSFLNEVRILSASPSKKSLLQRAFSIPRDQAFVIMKFGDKYLDDTYSHVVKPAIEKIKITPLRIDEIPNSGKISDQILDHIASSKFIYADLTGGRSNCYYETGFAHALGKDVILAIRQGEEIPFDVRDNRFIIYESLNDLSARLRERLRSLV
jgi:hypothetical protein